MKRIAVFASGSGSNLKALIDTQVNYSISVVVTDRLCKAMDIAKEHNIPVIYHSYKKLQKSRNEFDALLVEELKVFPVDIVVLAGYMRLVGLDFLNHFPMVINVHPGDLSVIGKNGERLYAGIDAVSKALRKGEKKTRSCVIQVDQGVDTGKILGFGPWVSYCGSGEITDRDIQEHQERQKRLSDWPVLIKVVEGLCAGFLPSSVTSL